MARDFNTELKKQLRLLERSCKAYDAGDHDEAVRIATQLAIMLHDKHFNAARAKDALKELADVLKRLQE